MARAYLWGASPRPLPNALPTPRDAFVGGVPTGTGAPNRGEFFLKILGQPNTRGGLLLIIPR